MTLHDILEACRKRKGEFYRVEEPPNHPGPIRHKTILDKRGSPCCPLGVVCQDQGKVFWNGEPWGMGEFLGLGQETPLLIRAADNTTSATNPYRSLLEQACL